MNAIEIRRISAGDIDEVCSALTSRPHQMHRHRLTLQERGGFVYLIAWLGGTPVGFVGVGMHEDASPDVLAEARGSAMVSDLFVEEPHRRQGVARALMTALEAEARGAGMPGVILDSGIDESFGAARALYASLGYVDQGGVYLGGWSDPNREEIHFVDPLTLWLKTS
ncbi:MAG: GNAT family N-acetyltransferase [Actinomycetota bacterium]